MRYEDALCALEIAKQGIVPGGGICLYQISEEIKPTTMGAKILQKALSMPLKTNIRKRITFKRRNFNQNEKRKLSNIIQYKSK